MSADESAGMSTSRSPEPSAGPIADQSAAISSRQLDGTRSWRPLLAPLAFLLAAAVLLNFITDRPDAAAAMARGIAGPTTWPRLMLFGVMLFAAGWAVQRAIWIMSRSSRLPAGPVGDGALKPQGRVWVGIALILGYGFCLPLLGFPLATLLYLVLWLLLGGIRSPLQIGLIGGLGTTVLLYLFVKLALMPLDRGEGVIGEWTIALYRLMHIF